MRRHRHFRRARSRWLDASGDWQVRARVERFIEPALLLLLRERSMQGYELLELLPGLVGEDRVDVGNLYRALRSLEEDGVVRSEWSADLPGTAKRTYEMTPAGTQILDAWAGALRENQELINDFLHRYDEERR